MQDKIQIQLSAIDALLRDQDFGLAVARLQHATYFAASGETVPPFLTEAEENAIVTKTVSEEKIAGNLAGFYAVECGLGVLCDQTGEKPTAWLEKIISGKADTGAVFLLNRFANATWKAGQPFRGLDNIKRAVFRSANFLPVDEIQKDNEQVRAAAAKLLSSLQLVKDDAMETQMKKIRTLLQSRSYALEMAAAMEAAYTSDKNNETGGNKKITRSFKDQKIATNLAGFYALECCTNYLVCTRSVLPSDLLKSIIDNSIGHSDRALYNRFANATWKAGQPFRGLERIERKTFTPFYFLSKADIDKDWVQVQTAAKKLVSAL